MKKITYSFILFLTAGLFACNKQSTLPDHYAIIPGGNTNVKFLMLSPNAPQANFFINSAKISGIAPTTTGVVQGLVFPQLYPASVAYSTFTAGAVKVDIKVTDSSTVMPGQTLLSVNQTFAPNKFYTFAVVDSLSKISTVVIEDDPTVPDPTKSYFRVANFVSNFPSMKIEVVKTSSGTPLTMSYPNLAFKSVTAFDTLAAGAGQVYKIYLKHPISDKRLDSISAFTPTPSKKYTIYTRGVAGLPDSTTNAKRPIITSYTNF